MIFLLRHAQNVNIKNGYHGGWILLERISVYGNTMRNIRVRFYDVRTAACHKYRRCKLANCLRLRPFLLRGERFRVSLIGFTTPEISFWKFLPLPPLKKKKTRPRRLFSNMDKLHFYGSRNLGRFNFFIPGEYAGGLKSLLRQFILRLYFSSLHYILYFLFVLNYHQSRLDIGIFNR